MKRPLRASDRDRKIQMLSAHVVPRKGMMCIHGAEEMEKEINKLGYKDIILKSDGEPALKSVQEEVERRRNDPTILENSAPGDSGATGAAERVFKSWEDMCEYFVQVLKDDSVWSFEDHTL